MGLAFIFSFFFFVKWFMVEADHTYLSQVDESYLFLST